MSTSKNKKAVHRFSEEVFNKGNLAVIPELFTDDFVFHYSTEYKGPEGVKQLVTNTRASMPDYHETIDHMVAEGDMVATFYTMTGTFTGNLAGVAPTGKKMSVKNVALSRFKNGKQVESWGFLDSLDMYRQLGIPIPQA